MKRIAIAIFALLVSASAQAAGDSYVDHYINGYFLNEQRANNIFVMGYAAGVVDTYDGLAFCIPFGVNLGQLAAIVKKHLADHPEAMHLPASYIVISALIKVYPCRPTKPQKGPQAP